MTLLYPWVLFFLLPLFLLYKNSSTAEESYKKRQKRLFYLALFFILLALSRPVIIKGFNEQKFDAEDFIIALDASYSMQADDLTPSRYAVAKQNIQKVIESLNRDRFSLFAFTTNAMLISPPTTDTAISMQALNSLEPKYILTKGTSLLALFETIAKTSFEKKKLLIFSDGGEDHDLESLIKICKKNTIIPYIVAIGSIKGTVLKKDGKTLKDNNDNLVISRINPILKPLALECGGKYYELSSSDDISRSLIADIKTDTKTKETKVKELSYTELFIYPLFIALILFFMAVTKIHQLYLFIPLLFMPHQTHASTLFDFYYLKEAKQSFKAAQFDKSADAFLKTTPSVASYYNAAVAYYKAKKYKKAIELFTKIESTNPQIKQKIYYNLGNCAVKLKKYDRAKIYYQKALGLGEDKDARANLFRLYQLQLKEGVDISDMLPKNEVKKKTAASKKENVKKKRSKSSSSSSNANQKASQKSAGSGANKSKKKKSKAMQSSKKTNKEKYKIGYKVYELINKGYTNEQHPW
ncbi:MULTISPECIES: VWA domain-containing protein [Sulfurimonas]|uniref:VWA domain-containing protein n=1 Tax=Sulfurimonas TaxID=202746 RepID=UPI001264BC3A|nr:VWA domain-containing protein [Sulfurimonas indica]